LPLHIANPDSVDVAQWCKGMAEHFRWLEQIASRVDTIIVTPSELTLEVGDTIPGDSLRPRAFDAAHEEVRDAVIGGSLPDTTVIAVRELLEASPDRSDPIRVWVALRPGETEVSFFLGPADSLPPEHRRVTRVSIRVVP
jgi:hypothetical protein